jgi:hypothetical protein
MPTKYEDLSPAVLELVQSIRETHNRLRYAAEYQYLTKPESLGGLGRVSLREYLANLKCAVFNSVSRIQVGENVVSPSLEFGRDAAVGIEYLRDLSRLSLLEDAEKEALNEAGVLPFTLWTDA